MWDMARREAKATGETDAIRHLLFCAIIWHHVKLLRSSKSGVLGKAVLVITLDQGFGGPLHGMLFGCVRVQVFFLD